MARPLTPEEIKKRQDLIKKFPERGPFTKPVPPGPVKKPGGSRVMDTRKPDYPTNPVRRGESKTQYLERVRSEKGGTQTRPVTGGPKVPGSNYSGTRGMSSADPGSGGGRRNMGPGSGLAPVAGGRGIVKGLPTPKKSAPREKVVLRDANGQRIKDRKPVLYSGSGMKSGGMAKGKK